MEEEKIENAITYAQATNKIEDLNLSNEELDQIIDAIKKEEDSKDFINNITSIDEEKHDKIK